MSAAYAIASAVDRLYVTRTGEVGSVGVVAVHIDESGADAKAGLAWTFVFSGDRKVDGNAHERYRNAPARRSRSTSTASPTLGDLLKYELNGNYSRETVTLKAGTNYPLGSVLGKITPSGKYRLSPAAQVVGDEGAETAVAVFLDRSRAQVNWP